MYLFLGLQGCFDFVLWRISLQGKTLFLWHEDVGCTKDRSLWGLPSLLSQFFPGSHLRSPHPGPPESWKIPEVTGTPLLKSESGTPLLKGESGARTPFPAVR